MKLIKNAWLYVLIVGFVLLFTNLFSRPIDYLDNLILRSFPSDNPRVLDASAILILLVLPLIFTYFLAKFIISRTSKRGYRF